MVGLDRLQGNGQCFDLSLGFFYKGPKREGLLARWTVAQNVFGSSESSLHAECAQQNLHN